MSNSDDLNFRRRMRERREVKDAQRRGVCAYDEGACACTGTKCPRREARMKAILATGLGGAKERARADLRNRMGFIPGLEDL